MAHEAGAYQYRDRSPQPHGAAWYVAILPAIVIAGLPWTAWLLLLVAVGLPLALELAFLVRARRRSARSDDR